MSIPLNAALLEDQRTKEWLAKRVVKLEAAMEAIKAWRGVMHTPAYGEWNKRGWWERNNHIFGTPQVSNMCREILEILTDLENENENN